jgi:hypothetical protein
MIGTRRLVLENKFAAAHNKRSSDRDFGALFVRANILTRFPRAGIFESRRVGYWVQWNDRVALMERG